MRIVDSLSSQIKQYLRDPEDPRLQHKLSQNPLAKGLPSFPDVLIKEAHRGVHQVSKENEKKLTNGRKYWLSFLPPEWLSGNPMDSIKRDQKESLKAALLIYLNEIEGILENGIEQPSKASIALSKETLEENLKKTPTALHALEASLEAKKTKLTETSPLTDEQKSTLSDTKSKIIILRQILSPDELPANPSYEDNLKNELKQASHKEKQALLTKLIQQEYETHTTNTNTYNLHLLRTKIRILQEHLCSNPSTYSSPDDIEHFSTNHNDKHTTPTSTDENLDASLQSLAELYTADMTLDKLYKRARCLKEISEIKLMMEGTTYTLESLYGYCQYALAKSPAHNTQNEKTSPLLYQDPEKIETLVGVLTECAMAYADTGSCMKGIIERLEIDGNFLYQETQATEKSKIVLETLSGIAKNYTGNKLSLNEDRPIPLLDLLIMDTLLKKHSITEWSVCGEAENRKKLSHLTKKERSALQDNLEAEKNKLLEEREELIQEKNESPIGPTGEENKKDKIARLTRKNLVPALIKKNENKLSNLYELLKALAEIPEPENMDKTQEKAQDVSISVEESHRILQNLVDKKNCLELTADQAQALAAESEKIESMIESLFDPSIDSKDEFESYHSAFTDQLVTTLCDYGLTQEHSRILVLTACLKEGFARRNKLEPIQFWSMAYSNALSYLNKASLPKIGDNHDYQQSLQESVQQTFLEPIQHGLDELLQLKQETVQTQLECEDMSMFALPAVCRDKEQAEKVFTFLVDGNPLSSNDINVDIILAACEKYRACIANNDLSFFAHMNRNIMKTIMHISPETIEKMADSFITAYKEEPNSSIFSHLTNQEGESLVTSFMESSPAIIYKIMKAHIEKGDCSIFQYTNSNCLTTLIAHKPTVIVELIDNYLKQNKKDILTQKNKNNQDILEALIACCLGRNNQGAPFTVTTIIQKLIEQKQMDFPAASKYLELAKSTGQNDLANDIIEKMADSLITAYRDILTQKNKNNQDILEALIACCLGRNNQGAPFTVTTIIQKLIEQNQMDLPAVSKYLEQARSTGQNDLALELAITFLPKEGLDFINNNKDDDGYTALHRAMRVKNEEISLKLIKHFRDLNCIEALTITSSHSNNTPLLLALKEDKFESARQLIEIYKEKSPTSLSQTGYLKNSPLLFAVKSRNKKVAEMLITALADTHQAHSMLTQTDLLDLSALDHTLRYEEDFYLAYQILCHQEASPQSSPAADKNMEKTYSRIIEMQVSSAATSRTETKEKTEQLIAIGILTALYSANPGPRLTTADEFGDTALHIAMQLKDEATSLKLIEYFSESDSIEALTQRDHYIKVNEAMVQSKQGNTPLLLALMHKKSKSAEKLIRIYLEKSPESLIQPGYYQNTPLMAAIIYGELDQALEIISALTTEQAHTMLTQKNQDQMSAFDYAQQLDQNPNKIANEIRSKYQEAMKKNEATSQQQVNPKVRETITRRVVNPTHPSATKPKGGSLANQLSQYTANYPTSDGQNKPPRSRLESLDPKKTKEERKNPD